MKMSKTSQKMIDAIRSDNNTEGSLVEESTIMGTIFEGDEKGEDSLALILLNGRKEVTILAFADASEVTELCIALQAASEATFKNGDSKPEVEFDA